MIDFRQKESDWKKSMDIIMQNVNLSKINILDNVTMVFEFLNSYDGADHKKIICNSVWKLSSEIDLSMGNEFPIFVCDIRLRKLENDDVKPAFEYYGFGLMISELTEYYLLCIESGEVSINIICESIEVSDM